MMIAIAAILAALISVIALIVVKRRERKDELACIRAGELLMREKELDSRIFAGSRSGNRSGRKMLVRLKWKDGQVYSYVFDPGSGIRFGRGEGCDISVLWESISAEQCILFERNGNLYVEDLNSANGTFILRGRKTYRAAPSIQVTEGDTISIGDIHFRIHIFYVNTAHA